jgi:hypothetical protein
MDGMDIWPAAQLPIKRDDPELFAAGRIDGRIVCGDVAGSYLKNDPESGQRVAPVSAVRG